MRRYALFACLAAAALAAGCATPPDDVGPEARLQDADHDGIPDGNAPEPWANEPEPGDPDNVPFAPIEGEP